MATRYMMASEKVKSELPKWKRIALEEDLSTKYKSCIVDEYVENVNKLAEDDSNDLFLTA